LSEPLSMTSPMTSPTHATAALPSGALRLADWGVIRARGEDARTFLQGQLTQDVKGLTPEHARPAGWCSAKGRLLASFVMWSPAPEQVLLACSADLLAPTLKRLSMFVMRSKCKLDDASADLPLWGLAGGSASAWLGDAAAAPAWSVVAGAGVANVTNATNAANAAEGSGAAAGMALRLPDAAVHGQPVPRWLWLPPQPDAAPPLPALDAALWAGLEALSAMPRIVSATAEHFVPQMVNLEVVGGVNFQKGCYPGQEVVARSQYRGTLKRRAFVLAGEVAMAPAQEVFHSDDPGQPAGAVVLAGRDPEGSGAGSVALVELKIATLATGTLHLGAADGPLLQPRALPYALPTEAA